MVVRKNLLLIVPSANSRIGIRQARALAAKDLEARELHPETMTVFRQQYAGRVEPSDLALFLRSLDDYLKRNLDQRIWLEVLDRLVR